MEASIPRRGRGKAFQGVWVAEAGIVGMGGEERGVVRTMSQRKTRRRETGSSGRRPTCQGYLRDTGEGDKGQEAWVGERDGVAAFEGAVDGGEGGREDDCDDEGV